MSQHALKVVIKHGYSFRNAIQIAKSEIVGTNISLLFSKEKLEISFLNEITFHHLEFDTMELGSYEYFIIDEETGELCDNYCFTVDISELFTMVKNVGRQDGIALAWYPEERRIRITTVKSGSDISFEDSVTFLNIVDGDDSIIEPDISYQAYDDLPSFRVDPKEFGACCANVASKCNSMKIEYGSKLKVCGYGKTGTLLVSRRFNGTGSIGMKPEDKPGDEILEEYILNGRTAKALNKIHNVSGIGVTIKFYYCEGLPLKMTIPIAGYGVYRIYIPTISSVNDHRNR